MDNFNNFNISVLISSTSCSSYPYTEDDETMGFGPIGEEYMDIQTKFKTDEKYDISGDSKVEIDRRDNQKID